MPGSAWALAAEAAVRAASLNLCTDDTLLLLARPEQIVSVSHLSHMAEETALWRQARRYPANDGSLESAIRQRPTLLFTMGGGGRARTAIAARLGIQVVELPYPATPADAIANARRVARALGRPLAVVAPYEAEWRRLMRSRPRLREGAFVSGGGRSLSPDGLSAQWLELAGYRQPALPDARFSLERLATKPPKWLIRSDYRAANVSRGNAWFAHPLVRRLAPRTIRTDGRPWICGGLPMLAEIARLQEARP